MNVTTDTIRKVYDDHEGVFIQVGPDDDALGLVEVKVTNPKSKEFFGDCNITMNPEYAKAVALAILKTCQEVVEGSQ